jgi:hypothetical protein
MEARHQERLLPGHAYIAPGGLHLRVERNGANYMAMLDETEPVNRHRPSVEVLFHSVAQCVGPNAIGVMLTGMGRDGADAMRRMRDAGAYNIAQDEATCVVYGMPREAVLAGAVHESLPVDGGTGRSGDARRRPPDRARARRWRQPYFQCGGPPADVGWVAGASKVCSTQVVPRITFLAVWVRPLWRTACRPQLCRTVRMGLWMSARMRSSARIGEARRAA